jgi:hypothetical protein
MSYEDTCLLACVLAVHHGLLIPINFNYTPHVLDTLAVTGCNAIRQSLDERRPPGRNDSIVTLFMLNDNWLRAQLAKQVEKGKEVRDFHNVFVLKSIDTMYLTIDHLGSSWLYRAGCSKYICKLALLRSIGRARFLRHIIASFDSIGVSTLIEDSPRIDT